MNPGITEETGKAVGGFLDAMKGTPMVLAMIVTNLALLGYLFWSGREIINIAHQSHNETRELLNKCIDKVERPAR